MPLGFFAAAAAQSDLSDAWPTVDCGALLADDGGSLAANGGGRSARGAALASLRSALETRGFFYCSNLDVLMDADYIASVYEFSRRAHALPADVKRRFARPRGGYSGSDAGVEELAYEAGTTSAVRAWDYARENNSSQGFWFRNRYPDFSPSFEEFIGEPGLRLVVGRRDSVVNWATAVGDLFARQQRLAVALLEGAHTDFEAFTLMHQSAAGLQLRAVGEGAGWEDAPVRPAEFVVIIGDLMTNGVLQAKPHERYAIIRFNALRADTPVAPLAPFVTAERPKAYSDTTMAEIMEVTIGNLEAGRGAWDAVQDRSSTARFDYDEWRRRAAAAGAARAAASARDEL
ncbi:hypothetical protein EMIHUDRAFT_197950 [Emiliania huxleyi CCMP1516]|uniref:Uncharacterized protein n=2 Tax=Emiliania huxleyi TaxID=2903 RepID=A0A0D3IE04_EMIH1|nr:hypothetical protein EMIHUDRAFT_197950 [Emiliania huxleyi CCMP1516]EOD09489.1 hypothetical protein EMIHUDRAFT_197950 [Emiliania huxleyi CCMP1516]|eukprot:XP_005761918.1 hypothetical protein EMIHUDRAFT_197950 [Emiliania huxleyi CCMP1516]